MLHQQFEIDIEKLALGGFGIGKHQGLVVFVPSTAPGDRVLVQVTEDKKSFLRAKAVKLLKASEHRRSPPCPHYGVCGGCNWQHLNYQAQLHWKDIIVREQLSRVSDEKTSWHPVHPSEKELRYRNRIQLKAVDSKIGYFERGSHQIVPIQDCLLADQRLIEKLHGFKVPASQTLERYQFSLREGGEVLVEKFGDLQEVPDFSQVNSEQNSAMIRTLTDWTSDYFGPRVYDLYAGAGNFSFSLLESIPKTQFISVEAHPGSSQKARAHALQRGLGPKKFEIFCSDVGVFLRREKIPAGSLVILDPPRVGCADEVIRNLAAQSVGRLIYISCNPSTLQRDLLLLKKLQPNGRLKRVASFDMFPQTDHVEVMIEWERLTE